jgi:hypothetical protein
MDKFELVNCFAPMAFLVQYKHLNKQAVDFISFAPALAQ